ncbi:MAG: stalk domain-containing protein [Bacillota bacterium]
MQTVWRHRGLVALLALLMILAAGLLPPTGVRAAVGSSYSYIVDGEEVAVGYDALSLRNTLLLPQELFTTLGVLVREGAAGSLTLTRGDLSATVKVGSRVALSNGERVRMATPPIRANGQVYLPQELLPRLGIQAAAEGNLLLIDRWPLAEPTSDGAVDFAAAVQANSATAPLEMADRKALTATLTRLTPEIVRHADWTGDPAVRGHALDLLGTSVLFDLTIHNQTSGFYQFQLTNLFLVDDLGNQYLPTGEIIHLQGDLSALLAPTAKARGVVIFPPMASEATSFKVYAKGNQWSLAGYSAK